MSFKAHSVCFVLAFSLLIASVSYASTPVRVKYTEKGQFWNSTWSTANQSDLPTIQKALEWDYTARQVVEELKEIEPIFYNRAKCPNADRFYLVEIEQRYRTLSMNNLRVSVRCGGDKEILLGKASGTAREETSAQDHADYYIRSMLAAFNEEAQAKSITNGLVYQNGVSGDQSI